MHDDSALVSERLERVMRTVEAHLWEEMGPVEVSAWHAPGEPVRFEEAIRQHYEPIHPRTWWGRAWSTMWLHVVGEIPPQARGRRVELAVDLGFSGDWAGNQCEGMVFTAQGAPLKAVNPMNHTVVLSQDCAALDLYVECAANPNLSHQIGHHSAQGDLQTRTDELLYCYAGARLVVRRDEVHALALDLSVAHGIHLELPDGSTRRSRLLRALEDAADALDSQDVVGTSAAAREALRGALDLPAEASAQNVMAIGHAHIDSAWLWPIRETRRKTVRTFSNVLALAREYPDFHFACTTPQQYEWVRQEAPEVFDAIIEAVAAGQWHPVGGMWVESDANLPCGEALVRQFTSGLRWMQQHLGVRPRCLWLPDSFGYTAALPQIAHLAGMQWFFTQKLSWNRTNTMPHHTFWWEGMDGTRLWTHFPPVDCYDSVVSPAEVKKAERNFSEKGRASWSLLPFGYGDGGGGPTRDMVERIHRMADLEGAPRLHQGSPDDFFNLASAERRDLPVWVGELYLEFHRGCYTSQAAMKRGNRRSEHLLLEVEYLATLASRRGADYPHEHLEQLWRRVLLLQFHDILPGSSIAWVHREARADYEAIARELFAEAARAMGDPNTSAQGRDVVANASHLPRREVVSTPGGQLDLVQVQAGCVVPLSQARVRPRRAVRVEQNPDGIVLDNGLVRAVIDGDGLLSRVRDLVAEREVLLPGHRANLLQLHPDLPCSFDAWELEEHYRHRVTDLVRADEIAVSHVSELRVQVSVRRSFGSSTVHQVITLDADQSCIDIATTVDWREREKILKASFPVAVHAQESIAEVQFGHLRRPVHANTSWDAARFEVWAHRWMMVAEASYGVAVANDATYGHDVTMARGSDGRRGVDLRLSLLRAPGSPDPTCDLGVHEMRYSLVVGADLGAAHAAGTRLNQPLRVTQGVPAAGLVAPKDPGIVVDAIKQAFDGSGDIIVRLHEATGGSIRGGLGVNLEARGVVEVDLLEDPVDAPTQHLSGQVRAGDVLALDLRPFQILSLRLVAPQAGSSGAPIQDGV